jgi:hypothetical protein
MGTGGQASWLKLTGAQDVKQARIVRAVIADFIVLLLHMDGGRDFL